MSFSPQRRLWVLFLCTAGLFGLLALRLIDLQLLRSSYYEAVAASQRQRSSELAPSRGTIYMSEGRQADLFPVASNTTGWIAYAIPREMTDPQAVAREVAQGLFAFRQRQESRNNEIIQRTGQNRPRPEDEEESEENQEEDEPELTEEDQIDILRSQLYEKFNQKTDPYEPLLRPYEVLDDEFKQFLEERQLEGIVVAERQMRTYPEETLAAHVLGYVGWDGEGQTGRYGIEEYFDRNLAGDLGWLFSEQDTAGNVIGVANRGFEAPEDGVDVVLTIDRVIQSYIEEELKAGVEKYGAERGTIIVMNPKTGAVLGMATYPTYDPNYYYAIEEPQVQTNPAVSDLFEPGSILKPVIMAGAIEEDMVEPNTTFTDSGPVKVDKYTIDTYDHQHWGLQTMTQVLEKSNNVGMVWVGQQMGAEMMYDYLRRFGLGEQTGIELAGETRNTLPEPDEWNIAQVATTSFGQGVALTPLQSLNAINVLANDGVLMQPYVTSRVQSQTKEDVHQPTSVRQVVSQETAAKVSAMMVSVIENGVAGLARVPGYYLAGKTGTAQVPDERGRYSEDKKIISFAGFGPVEDPEFSVLVKLDNPSGLSFASGTAAPMFRNISEKILNYYQIPPSYDPDQAQPTFQVPTDPTGDGA